MVVVEFLQHDPLVSDAGGVKKLWSVVKKLRSSTTSTASGGIKNRDVEIPEGLINTLGHTVHVILLSRRGIRRRASLYSK
jgi:hypothetical protein